MKILIIDDEQRILAFVSRALRAVGHEVACAEDGADGLAQAIRGAYDLVVLDLGLPRVDGLDVLDALRHARPELPVLVLSARNDAATKLRATELGARDYLAKPFALDDLLARVRAQAVPSSPARSEPT